MTVIKRIVWWTTGALMGVGGSTYLQIKFRKAVQAKVARFTPPHVVDAAAARAKGLRSRAGAAVGEGKAAMAARESELRSRITRRSKRSDQST